MRQPGPLGGLGKRKECQLDFIPGIDWVICGSETGPNRREVCIEWIGDLCDQCEHAGVPFFLKQMEADGKIVKMPKLNDKVWDRMPEVE